MNLLESLIELLPQRLLNRNGLSTISNQDNLKKLNFSLKTDSQTLTLKKVNLSTLIIGKKQYRNIVGLSLLKIALEKNLPIIYLNESNNDTRLQELAEQYNYQVFSEPVSEEHLQEKQIWLIEGVTDFVKYKTTLSKIVEGIEGRLDNRSIIGIYRPLVLYVNSRYVFESFKFFHWLNVLRSSGLIAIIELEDLMNKSKFYGRCFGKFPENNLLLESCVHQIICRCYKSNAAFLSRGIKDVQLNNSLLTETQLRNLELGEFVLMNYDKDNSKKIHRLHNCLISELSSVIKLNGEGNLPIINK